MQYLKADTATTVRIGPFVDDTDGKTAESSLTIAQADVRLSKAGAVAAQKNDATSATHDENGYYRVPLDATDTNTEGSLDVCVSVAGALPVVFRYEVLPAEVFDAIVGGTDKLQVDVVEVDGSAASLGSGNIDANVVEVGGSAVAGVGDFANAVWDKDVSLYATVNQAGTLLKTAEANTDDLKTTTTVKANVVQISGDSVAADNLESYCDGTTPIPSNVTQINGSSASVASSVDANVTQVGGTSVTGPDDLKATVPTTGAIADAVWDEAQSGHATAGTFGSYLDASVSGVSTGGVSAADIADAVWDEALSGHVSAGSAGKALADTETDAASAASGVAGLNDPTAAQVASAVRSELTTELGRVDASISSREASGAAAAAAAGLNDPTAAQVATAVRSELSTEMGRIDAAVSSRSAAGDAMTLTAGERTSVATALLDLANAVETGITTREALRAMLAVLAGKVSGMDSNVPVFRSADDTANRVSATTDSSGNRSAVTLNLS